MAKGHSKEHTAGKTTSNRKTRRLALQESESFLKPKPKRIAEIERYDVDNGADESGYSTGDTFSHSGDEEFDDGDTSVSSVGAGSVGRVLEPEESPAEGLNDCIASIQEFKKANSPKNVAERIKALTKYLGILRAYYLGHEISAAFTMIRDTLLRLITSPGSAQEQLLAVQCLSVSMLSCASAGSYEEVKNPLRRLCQMENTTRSVKCALLQALGVAVVYCDSSDEDFEEVLEFLLEAIDSDGSSLEATDSGDVVATALHAWAFVAAHHDDDLEDVAISAMDAFEEQLGSTDVEVIGSAAFNIALVFESSRQAAEQQGSRGFNIRQDPRELVREMKGLTQQSKSIVGRRNGREVASRLGDAIAGLEHGYGPNYATSGRPLQNPHVGVGKAKFLDPRDFREFGYRDKVVDRDGNTVLTVSTWAQSAKVKMLRTLLARDSYVATHLLENPEMRDNVFPTDDEDEESEDDEE